RRARVDHAHVVPRDARAVADRAALPQDGDERRLRRPGRHDGVRGLGHADVLHHRRGPRGQGGLPREAQARLLAVQALPVMSAWVAAARLRTLPAAVVPVAVGTACAAASGGVVWGPALAALGGALAIQI